METRLQPVLLGGDINCYSVARAYHEQYHVKSIAIGKVPLGATKDSKIIDFRVNSEINDKDKFVDVLLKIADEISSENQVNLLHGCTDEYAELIIDNKDRLSEKYIVPYIDKSLKTRLIEKELFYKTCEEYNLDYPSTHIHNKGAKLPKLNFGYPLILKASDSISYFQHPFENMKKAYVIQTEKELAATINKIYSNGYEKSLIIQEFVPGDDSHMRVLTCYSDKHAKVKMMCLGHVLLEEHTPTAIGNHAAIVTEYNEELMTKFKNFLESIGYVGYSNFDIKYDSRDGKYKVFEINLRQGRSNYYVTASGNNIAKYVVEDRVYNKPLELKLQKEEFYWHVIPNMVVNKYVKEEGMVKKCKELTKAGKSATSFGYAADLKNNMKRKLYVFLYNVNQVKKFKKYYK